MKNFVHASTFWWIWAFLQQSIRGIGGSSRTRLCLRRSSSRYSTRSSCLSSWTLCCVPYASSSVISSWTKLCAHKTKTVRFAERTCPSEKCSLSHLIPTCFGRPHLCWTNTSLPCAANWISSRQWNAAVIEEIVVAYEALRIVIDEFSRCVHSHCAILKRLKMCVFPPFLLFASIVASARCFPTQTLRSNRLAVTDLGYTARGIDVLSHFAGYGRRICKLLTIKFGFLYQFSG